LWIAGKTDSVFGLKYEQPIETKLPTPEPAFFTNYGPNSVDVSAAGGNADLSAVFSEEPGWYYDLVFSTYYDTASDGSLVPSYAWLLGTSMSAPQVSGLAALVAERNPRAGPMEIRRHIETTARSEPIGRDGTTTAPKPPDVSYADWPLTSETYRNNGHINVNAAVMNLIGSDRSGRGGTGGGSGGTVSGGGSPSGDYGERGERRGSSRSPRGGR
jgi:subtilisin family serine protease